MMNHSPSPSKPKRAVIITAWANIAVQSLLPISLSLSPAVYAAMAENKQRTDALVVYQVQIGDTALSIAKQFGLTLEELKKLNSEAYKEKSLNAITVGDSLLVPDLRLGERKPAHSIAVKMEREPVDAEKFIAQAATTLASGSAVSSLRSVAVSQANQSVEEWLKQYGTAKVSINVDSDFNLTDSEADLLVGLNDTPETFSFTQLGLRHKEDRTTVNAGVGQRHFNAQDKDMLGYNLFLDHEIEAGHTRMGVGAEYWRDYVKLSANGYLRLSGWKASDELVDYDERAANGFDLRAEAYLPSHPQLGGKLKYEQYFGNEVALSDVNNRQKDPYAMTAGINYTPIPLVTVGVDYTKEKGQSGDTQFNLAFNYRLGESVDKQLDGASVAEYRSLAGSRYDLVDRNNNIVLEYRKQELLKLDLADAYRAPEKTEQQVEIAISSKYAIDRIEWQGREFFAAGGSMPVKVTDRIYKVTLPAYRAEGLNSYPLSAVAVDVKGNQSNTDTTQIDVTAVSIDRPEIRNLRINGVVELGSLITASYEWQPHNGDPVDKSLHQWGHQGKTAALDKATEISTSGTVPPYTVTADDVGQVLEVSVKAKNGQGVEADKPLTADTTQQYDPSIKPEIEDLALEGMLNIGNRLTATYRFDPKMGEPTDRSQYQWGHAGKTEALSQRQVISTSGRVESPTLSASDVGQVIKLSIRAENGLGVQSDETDTIRSDSTGANNGIEQVNPDGKVFDPTWVDVNTPQHPHAFGLAEGFPSTAYNGATFEIRSKGINTPSTAYNGYYNWAVSSGQTWVNVDDKGVVTFIGKAVEGESTITITATPKNSGAIGTQTYQINLQDWFIDKGTASTPEEVASQCQAEGAGYDAVRMSRLNEIYKPIDIFGRGEDTFDPEEANGGRITLFKSSERGPRTGLLAEWGAFGPYTMIIDENNLPWSGYKVSGVNQIAMLRVDPFPPKMTYQYYGNNDLRSSPLICTTAL